MEQKYFLALVPPEPLLSEIRQIKEQILEAYGTKGALRSPAHITLHMPFSWEEKQEERLLQTLSAFRFRATFSISLKNYDCFEPRVLFLDVVANEMLYALQKELVSYVRKSLQLFNQSDDMRGFHPHVTIAFRDLKKPVFYRLWEAYRDQVFERQFDCRSFCLLKHDGKSWHVLREFPFGGKE